MQVLSNKFSRSFLLLVLCFQQPACKHHHSITESIKQAFEIQKEALKIASEIDSLTMTLSDDSLKSSILISKSEWMKQKISIEALEPHDHSKCNHDHSHDSEINITDEEMILVQKEWRDSIWALKQKILLIK
jgi:predicted ribonuclease YlaK